MELNQIYFYSATILNWHSLLEDDSYKEILIDSLKHLVQKEMIKIYGFVIMPNHIHLIWELTKMNGNEKPNASFMKFTGHEFLKKMISNDEPNLHKYLVHNSTRNYHFWERMALPIHIYSREIIFQKLNYIHNNPCKGKWMLSDNIINYKYSSARFYENGVDEFGILANIMDRI